MRPVTDRHVLVVHLDLGRVLLGRLGLDVVARHLLGADGLHRLGAQQSVDGSRSQVSEASSTGSFLTKVCRSVSCFSRNSR